MSDNMYSWDILIPHRRSYSISNYYTAVRESFIQCGFSIRTQYGSTSGLPIANRFTVDHASAGAVSYWELRSGLVRFPDVRVNEVAV